MIVRIYFWSQQIDAISGYVSYSLTGAIRNLVQWAAGLGYPFDLYQLRDLLEARPKLLLLLATLYCVAVLVLFALVLGRSIGRLVTDRLFLLGLAWFFLTLLPVLGGSAHRWYLYLPSASLALLFAAFWQSADRKKLLIPALLGICFLGGLEIARQARLWQEQSTVSEAFFQELESEGVHEEPFFYFANVPFGYKSTYLFTFHSLEDAMYLRWGKRPDIYILSYLNVSDRTNADYNYENTTFSSEIEPDQYEFFLFPAAQRRFSGAGKTFKVRGAIVTLDSLTPAGTVSRYSVQPPKGEVPIFHFDGADVLQIR